MNRRRPFVRKVIYLGLVVLLFIPLSMLSIPSTTGAAGAKGSAGGKLARMRDEYRLSQSNLGEIDPTGEAIKLATLGMRGVAANVLWTKANRYSKQEDWTSLKATLDQITKLQPNFITVWTFQGWNLSYNISVQWDDYRERYRWVIKGIEFLERGTRYNENEPRLLWDIGWFTGQKIGRADERVQFRRLFREDDDYNGDRPPGRRDNWLVGKESFLEAQRVVDTLGLRVKGVTPTLFHSDPAMSQINYAGAVEEDGTFGEVARVAWQTGGREWHDYGRREFVSFDGTRYAMNDLEPLQARSQQLSAELHALEPDLMAKLVEERRQTKLTDEERELLATPELERGVTNDRNFRVIVQKLYVPPQEFATRLDETHRADGQKLADQIDETGKKLAVIRKNRSPLNFEYWRMRCEVESSEDALEARRLMHEGDQAFLVDADLETALTAYEKGVQHWSNVLTQYPPMLLDGITGEEVVAAVIRYERILEQLDQPFPEEFVLEDLMKMHDDRRFGTE